MTFRGGMLCARRKAEWPAALRFEKVCLSNQFNYTKEWLRGQRLTWTRITYLGSGPELRPFRMPLLFEFAAYFSSYEADCPWFLRCSEMRRARRRPTARSRKREETLSQVDEENIAHIFLVVLRITNINFQYRLLVSLT